MHYHFNTLENRVHFPGMCACVRVSWSATHGQTRHVKSRQPLLAPHLPEDDEQLLLCRVFGLGTVILVRARLPTACQVGFIATSACARSPTGSMRARG
eukprot:358490-Chlamydomonas_euryale.AAC.3